ncbi:8-amino-7-oxononanoate synthase [Luteibacter rhizovicinus]|uniref:8-amino-7-oxononanoate synthase n=1 Tax=Luteibacter rhizovicinus TaxID=242606 RepID=A0A4R3YJM0_9GAMM|nr:8-amino-7-oxononanoate synthase [Luteibacter rhizovicinus]TCV92420.1 8-amino-7-oxononanoate synthase [Luteibacter rhizovicinus]
MSRIDLLARLETARAAREEAGLLRRLRTVDAREGALRRIGERTLVDFCSNDYLGLADHPDLVAALTAAAGRDGVGSGAAHLVSGHHREHAALEEQLADWTGRERALLFSTGVMANLGAMQALLGAGNVAARGASVCVQDRLNHASLIDGALLAGSRLQRYAHGDVDDAMRALRAEPDRGALLATDGVFSMDGDVAPLRELAGICRDEGAVLYVDDAHGLGVLGPRGAGSLAEAGLSQADAPLLMGTLGKALGCAGAFVAGPAAMIDGIVQFARTYIYTTAMPPALAAATRVALTIARNDTEGRRKRLGIHIARFRAGAEALGLPVMPSRTAIQPLLLGDPEFAMKAATRLEDRGYLVTAIRPPTVPAGSARLRVTLSAAHEADQIDGLLEALNAAIGAHP